MSAVSELLSKAEGNKKPKPQKWYLMFIVNGNEFEGDTYLARKIDLEDIKKSARTHVGEMQDRLRKETDRVHDAWDAGVVDPGCRINFEGVFLANTDDDLDEEFPKWHPPGQKEFSWLVFSCKKGMIEKNPDGFSEEISGALIKNTVEIITKELEKRKAQSA